MIHARYTPLNLYIEFDKSNNIKQKKTFIKGKLSIPVLLLY